MTLTAEQRELQALARDFARNELRPRAEVWDAGRALDDELIPTLAELGFLGMLIPEAYGGLGLDFTSYLLVLEELAWGDAAAALTVAIHNGPVAGMLLAHGSEAQRERWLPPMARGEVLGAFALSEEGAGSDPSAMRTGARAQDGGWVLSGRKRWVTNGARAGMVVVMARTDDGGGTGAFLVEPASPGYRVVGRERTLGLRASETVSVELDEVAVGPDGLLGAPGRGLALALEALDRGRVGIAAQAVGIARAAMEHATAYALERRQFGQALAEFGATREKVAEMQRRITAARVLTFRAAAALEAEGDAGAGSRRGPEGITALAAMAKLTASETATWVADEAVQIFGGYGYMRDYPVERLLRDAKGTEIYEGTSEIMRHLIAREVFRAAGAT